MAHLVTRFPEDISLGASCETEFNTSEAWLPSGVYANNAARQDPIRRWDVAHGVKNVTQYKVLRSFYLVAKGKLNTFRFKDWFDFTVESGEGVFVSIDSTHFQLYKKYAVSTDIYYRKITRPVSGTLVITGGTNPSTAYETGIVTVDSGTPTAWTGQFDTLAKFDTDVQSIQIPNFELYDWSGINAREVLE